MGSNLDSSQPDLKTLVWEIRDLQQRVSSLERSIGGVPVRLEAEEVARPSLQPTKTLLEDTAKIVPIVGKALLGIAGAYLLRALTELRVVPLAVGVAIGMVYALGWLVLAARTAQERHLVAAVHAGTSVLILMPLVWEAAVRFEAISCWTAAGILFLFSGFGLAISWRRNLSVIASITVLAGVVTALALLTATHNMAPFTLALLAMAAAIEFSACVGHALGLRWMVAFAADLSVLLLTYMLTRESGLPEGYAPISRGIAIASQASLLVIYLSSTAVRILFKGFGVTTFETAQWLLAFLLSTWGALRVAHGDPAGVSAISIFSLACGAACYAVSFAFLGRAGRHDRNFYTYATFGLLLVFGGSRLLVSGTVLAIVLSVVALACLWTGRESGRMTLKWHGTLYLLSTSVLSGLFAWTTGRLLSSVADWVPPGLAIWISAAAALIGYAMAWRSLRTGDWPWTRRLVVLALAANCAWTVAGFAAAALTALGDSIGSSALILSLRPTLCTAVLLALSLLMAWSGTRWNRFEVVWLVYPLMVITAYKLAALDLQHSQTLSLFASLFLYGGTLVLLPRIFHKSIPGSHSVPAVH